MKDATATFDQFAILEVVGHRRLGGRVREASIGGVPLLRIDVFRQDGEPVTQYYGPSAIFCLTPATEESARLASRFAPPVDPYEVEMRVGASHREQLREALNEAVTALREIEWAGQGGTCPECRRLGTDGHSETCQVGAVLTDDEMPF